MFYILTKENFKCPWCEAADLMLWNHNRERRTIALPRDVLVGLGIKTVPQIFEGEKLIGGYDDLVKHLSSETATEVA
jgi:glutaredoxin